MFRKHQLPRGLPGVTLAIAVIGALTLAGCSSDPVTMPAQLSPDESDTESIPILRKIRRIPIPTDFAVQELCSSGATLTWKSPGRGLHAMIRVDGVVVARVDARDGFYMDTLAKSCGCHTFGVCFAQANRVGAEVRISATMPGIVEPVPKDPPARRDGDQ
ncbi:MAG: hypothetical protein FD129_2542 [bacterium]|nr:MAG: hypothetical protein FD129_2542 [bacterium]